MRPFTRRAAGELQLLAVLAPVICSNMSAEPCDRIFATDASTTHGAVCSLPVEPSLSLDFWLASDFKGAVHLSPVASLGAAGGDDEASVRECSSTLPALKSPLLSTLISLRSVPLAVPSPTNSLEVGSGSGHSLTVGGLGSTTWLFLPSGIGSSFSFLRVPRASILLSSLGSGLSRALLVFSGMSLPPLLATALLRVLCWLSPLL